MKYRPTTDHPPSSYRWVILLVVWVGYLLTFVDRLIWASVSGAASASLALPLAALGLFVTAFYVGYVVSTALTGLSSDWFGPRRTLSAALLPLGLFTFLFGYTTNVWTGVALQGLMGLTAGADYAAGVKIIMCWFDRRDRGRAMGLFMTATSLGVVVTNAVVPSLLGPLGWQNVYRIAGLMTAAFGVVCYLVLRDRPGPEVAAEGKPSFRLLLRNRRLMLLTAASFGGTWGTWGFAFWANALMVQGYHLSAVEAGSVVASFGGGAIIGKPLIGLASDWLGGRRRLPVICCLLSFAACLLLFGTLDDLSQFRMVAPLLGLTAFLYSPLLNTMIAESAEALAGSAVGIAISIGSIGTTLVPLVVGLAFQSTHSFLVAFVVLAVGPLLGTGFIVAVPEMRPIRFAAVR